MNLQPKEMTRHSAVMLVNTVISKGFSYVFYFLMARLLTPEEYGTLGALMSFFFIATVFTRGLQPAVAKFAAEFHSSNEKGKIKTLMVTSSRKLGLYGAFGLILVSIASPFLAGFLHIPSVIPIIIIGFSFALSTVLIVARGMLQGMSNFLNFGINLSLETFLRVVLGGLLVYIGLGVSGAMLALALAIFFSIIAGFLPLNPLLRETREKINAREIYTYSLPVIITSFATVAMLNVDVILVKHFFDASTAGYYAAASLLAKIPMILIRESLVPVVFTHSAKGGGRETLRTSFKYIAILLIPVLLLYRGFPEFVISLLYGQDYSPAARFLIWLFLPMSLMGINIVTSNYLLAKRSTAYIKYLIFALLLEIILISIAHPTILAVIGTLSLSYIVLSIGIFISNYERKPH